MRRSIAKRLAPLASLAAQRRWIIHGTADEYIVVDQLLEDAHDVVRQVREIPEVAKSLTPEAVAFITGLEPMLKSLDTFRVGAETLIEDNASWSTLRSQAGRCLEALAFSLRDWEKEEGLPDAV